MIHDWQTSSPDPSSGNVLPSPSKQSNSNCRCPPELVSFDNAPHFQIRNFYLFLLAFGYRQLSSLTTPQDHYRELLRVAENILAFLGSVSLALALLMRAFGP